MDTTTPQAPTAPTDFAYAALAKLLVHRGMRVSARFVRNTSPEANRRLPSETFQRVIAAQREEIMGLLMSDLADVGESSLVFAVDDLMKGKVVTAILHLRAAASYTGTPEEFVGEYLSS